MTSHLTSKCVTGGVVGVENDDAKDECAMQTLTPFSRQSENNSLLDSFQSPIQEYSNSLLGSFQSPIQEYSTLIVACPSPTVRSEPIPIPRPNVRDPVRSYLSNSAPDPSFLHKNLMPPILSYSHDDKHFFVNKNERISNHVGFTPPNPALNGSDYYLRHFWR